jgi:hypothetical protein
MWEVIVGSWLTADERLTSLSNIPLIRACLPISVTCLDLIRLVCQPISLTRRVLVSEHEALASGPCAAQIVALELVKAPIIALLLHHSVVYTQLK